MSPDRPYPPNAPAALHPTQLRRPASLRQHIRDRRATGGRPWRWAALLCATALITGGCAAETTKDAGPQSADSTTPGASVAGQDGAASAVAVATPFEDPAKRFPATQDYPWLVRLPSCGGSLIAPQWVLTAAHCITTSDGVATVGVALGGAAGEQIPWDRAVKHGAPGQPASDLAVLHLTRAASAKPVPMAVAAPAVGTASRLLGWGQDERGGTPSGLKQIDSQVVSAQRCESLGLDFRADAELCTDNPGGVGGACRGDSGGAQIANLQGTWRLMGVTSRGPVKCGSAPSIYVDVAAHLAWLESVTGQAFRSSQ